ncbi:hypothetical protein MCOR02_001617 [Pyricularia oryzae]|nr:hypothetical protein MCOR01_010976 [Pyricularia oryzae]KAH9437976.1 hypothetical protein MCOR02_001617 [Pyricularia oryzae]KAI6304034.1 hypothetical protein MCOR34_008809 [Pyricularia oryzae]KAI6360522.1 hypothetical protein MCOR32_008963 [Pyricularia oryzae]KAI6426633.1 hypothetical protein MCOR21_006582 [Pyricularia oryzae]
MIIHEMARPQTKRGFTGTVCSSVGAGRELWRAYRSINPNQNRILNIAFFVCTHHARPVFSRQILPSRRGAIESSQSIYDGRERQQTCDPSRRRHLWPLRMTQQAPFRACVKCTWCKHENHGQVR